MYALSRAARSLSSRSMASTMRRNIGSTKTALGGHGEKYDGPWKYNPPKPDEEDGHFENGLHLFGFGLLGFVMFLCYKFSPHPDERYNVEYRNEAIAREKLREQGVKIQFGRRYAPVLVETEIDKIPEYADREEGDAPRF